VPIPDLSGDRRKELVKMAASHAEEGRISVRQARHFAMDQLKKLKTEGHVSEDDIKRSEKEVQDQTDAHVKKINEALEAKEAELLSV
jgi:ribosome recycling factor